MTLTDELLQTLMDGIDTHSDATVRRDVLVLWQLVLDRFTPLIGLSSVYVLFLRCIEKNAAAFPWLPVSDKADLVDKSFSSFEALLETQEAGEAIRVTRALLGSYIDLLFALIGTTLTVKFICSVAALVPKKDRR